MIFDEAFKKLSRFAGTPVIVQVLAFPHSAQSTETEEHTEAEAYNFAEGFLSFLPVVGWKVTQDHRPGTTDWAPAGVDIWSRRWEVGLPPVGMPFRPMDDPYSLLLDTPRKKAWAAAEALTQYLRTDMGQIA
jgi:hypothetical protein